jgi:FkbM family methyltransferase
MSILAQRLFDASLRLPARLGRFPRRWSIAASTVMLRFATKLLGDPVVKGDIHGTRLAMPMSHALPRILMKHPDYSSNIGRIALAASRKYPSLTMIDIGANIGDTVAMVRRFLRVPTLCVDGDPRFFTLLSDNARQWNDVEIECAFVGKESGTVAGRIEASDGSGHLIRDAAVTTQVRTLEDIIDLHPGFHDAKLVKIDTDGFDTLIIKGALETLARMKPIVFLEYDPYFFLRHDPAGFEVFPLMRSCGYASALFFENTGEFSAQVALDDEAQLRAMHRKCGDRSGGRYFDVCMMHRNDLELIDAIRTQVPVRAP